MFLFLEVALGGIARITMKLQYLHGLALHLCSGFCELIAAGCTVLELCW